MDTDTYRKPQDWLKWFGNEVGHFRAAVGGDGAPFGNWGESISLLVSYLNVGPRVVSPNDSFLLFGANCKETHDVVVQFCKLLADNFAAIEQRIYTIGDVAVKFTFDLVPSDMKFLPFINGELCQLLLCQFCQLLLQLCKCKHCYSQTHFLIHEGNTKEINTKTEFGYVMKHLH